MGFDIIELVLKPCAGVVSIYQLLPTWIHSAALSSIITEESNIFIPAAILIASVISYIIPISNHGAVQVKQIKLGKTEITGAGSCVPDVKSYAAILFVSLHACGLLSNSYISEFSYLYILDAWKSAILDVDLGRKRIHRRSLTYIKPTLVILLAHYVG